MAAVAFPLMSSWRRTAAELVAQAFPTPEASGFDTVEEEKRTALEARLGLNTGLLRSPVAAAAVLTPLITTLLAVYIPELAPT
jgi:hypothetical protein